MKRILALCCCLGLLCLCPIQSGAAEKSKVVFISGKPSHGPMSHEHRAGNMILAKRLNASGLDVDAVVLPENGYPKDHSVLDDADTIVIFCTGHGGHVVNSYLKEFDALMKRGVGVVMIHWATEAVKGDPGDKFLEWMGGFCDLNWSVNPHWTPTFKPVNHPIWNGVETFSVNDEWYYHMRFVDGLKGVTPILSDLPGPETLKRKDGPRSGNPDVRRAVANGEQQHVAWAFQRTLGKGRGFGFTGGHNHLSWQNDGFRTIVLNAILWTAGRDVPVGGVPSATPSDEEMRLNLDDKRPRRQRVQAPAPTRAKDNREEAALSFQELRERHVRRVDSKLSLELLTRSLMSAKDPVVQVAVLRGMLSGLEGRRNVVPPEGWKRLEQRLASSGVEEVGLLTQRLNQIFGDERAMSEALATVKNTSVPTSERQDALRSLVNLQVPELSGVLRTLIDDAALRVDVIRAFGAIEDEEAPKLLLARYSTLDFQAKRATVETLSMRRNYARALLAGLTNQTVPRDDVPAYIARSLSGLLGQRFDDVYGDVQALSKDKAEIIEGYRKLLTEERLAKADVSQGRMMFQVVCASCHQLYGEGGKIGPDLTGSNRRDTDYILLNMIDPSADIPDAYKMLTIHTKGGQVMSGTLAAEDDQRVTLNLVGQQQTILKSDIEKRELSPLSMMPEGLLPALQDSQVLDLVKYLRTTEQVALPQ